MPAYLGALPVANQSEHEGATAAISSTQLLPPSLLLRSRIFVNVPVLVIMYDSVAEMVTLEGLNQGDFSEQFS
jgi:hypothetical protein